MVELSRNAENYFAEIEQGAMSPSNVVPGIGSSPGKLLQARIFSHAAAHRRRTLRVTITAKVTTDFSQPRALFRRIDNGQRQGLFGNIAAAMAGVPQFIVEHRLALFDKVDPAHGAGVRKALMAAAPEQPRRAA